MAGIALKKVKIPTSMDPFVVEVNGWKYEYPAGTEQEVPEEVAAVIENIEGITPKPDPRAGEPSFESLRDKPFGEYTKVLFDKRVEFGVGPVVFDGTVNSAEQVIGKDPYVSEDSRYICEWDGSEYDLIGVNNSNKSINYIGNLSLTPYGGVDTGEPFCIVRSFGANGKQTIYSDGKTHTCRCFEFVLDSELGNDLDITAGDDLTVAWDGVKYAVSVIDVGGALIFGNMVGLGMEDSGEPFLAIFAPEEGEAWAMISADMKHGFHSVKIEKTEIHKLDPKFLPTISFNVNVWWNGSDYASDKTYAEIKEAESKRYPIVGTFTNKYAKVYTMIGCDAAAANMVRLASLDVESINLKVYSIYIMEDGYVGVNVTSHAGVNVDE